jgi:hypothetical protein
MAQIGLKIEQLGCSLTVLEMFECGLCKDEDDEFVTKAQEPFTTPLLELIITLCCIKRIANTSI